MAYLIDTHAHLDMFENWAEIYENAQKNNVKKIIIPAVETKYFQKIIDISNSLEGVYCMLGLFPSETKSWNDETANLIRELSKNDKVVAIGEIGLDYYWDKSFTDIQKDVFIKQIKLANELGLPIDIHDREAHKDTFDILKEHNKGSEVVFHCFSGSPEFASECIREGWYIALGGVVTFKNAVKTKEVAKIVPIEKLLLETDAPYLTPVPYRGKQNQPAYVKYAADEIARLRGIEVEELISATSENAERVFKI